jgi:UDP:flavonoid glycosyltransferase YjiC (YdhE family)
MSRILLTWEMGGGYGHLVRLRMLAEPLIEEGHDVTIALHDPRLAPRYLDDLDLNWIAAPSFTARTKQPLALKSFPEILLMQGFNEAEALYARIRSWQGIYDLVKPDVVVYDHSTTAMLAYRGRDARQVAVGTGFFNPPRVSPLPLLRPWLDVSDEQLLALEQRVLGIINLAAIRAGIHELEYMHDLFDLQGMALLTYPEIDHYQDRGEADYWGIPPNPEGEACIWPQGEGPKIFAYLKPFAAMQDLLKVLKKRGGPTIVHAPMIPPELKAQYEGSNILLTGNPVDIDQAAREADVCICNGGHGTVATMLLAGTPMLILPQHLEQLIMAQRLEALGAATLDQKLQPKTMKNALDKLLAKSSFKEAAEGFANSHERNTADRFFVKVLNLAFGT